MTVLESVISTVVSMVKSPAGLIIMLFFLVLILLIKFRGVFGTKIQFGGQVSSKRYGLLGNPKSEEYRLKVLRMLRGMWSRK